MNIAPVKIPGIAKKLFPNYVWNIPTDKKVIYLTFDDGPTPSVTHWTLNILKQYNAKATFFCVGNNIKKHPEIFSDVLNAGHAIGNHTQNHIKGWRHDTKSYLEEIKKTDQIISSLVTQPDFKTPKSSALNYQNTNSKTLATHLFRPPYGQIKPAQSRALRASGYHIIMWDILSLDWDVNSQPKDCLNSILLKTNPGSILVFHDSIKASKNMKFILPKVLSHFSKKGYSFKTL